MISQTPARDDGGPLFIGSVFIVNEFGVQPHRGFLGGGRMSVCVGYPPSVNGDVLWRPPALAVEHFPAFFLRGLQTSRTPSITASPGVRISMAISGAAFVRNVPHLS
jgi:hypothetical protein